MIWKQNDGDADTKVRKKILDMDLKEKIIKLKEEEKNSEVRSFMERTLNKLP